LTKKGTCEYKLVLECVYDGWVTVDNLFRALKMSKHDQEMKDLSDILYAMELKYNEREGEAQQDFQSIMDELKNKVGGSNPARTFNLFTPSTSYSHYYIEMFFLIEFGGYTCS